jgi:replication-associated recombination protein RarA
MQKEIGPNLFGEEYPDEPKQGEFSAVTKNKIPLDVAVSALQKYVRRGMEYEAVWIATELNESGFWKYLFRRLMVISAEDIGLACPSAAVLVATVYSSLITEWQLKKAAYFVPDNNRVDMVVMYLCRAQKSRTIDYLGGIIYKDREKEELVQKFVSSIPDYIKDMHTKEGKVKGMGEKEFFEEGAKIENKGEVDKDEEYKKECLEKYGFGDMARDESKF